METAADPDWDGDDIGDVTGIDLICGGKGEQYMHSSRKPLAEVDLSTAEDHGQIDLFNNECEGMCGV